MAVHIPVLVNEVVQWLNLKPGDTALDATVGEGGHAKAILAATSPDGQLIGIDLDRHALASAQRELARVHTGRFTLMHGNFKDLNSLLHGQQNRRQLRAVLCDLGISSLELQDASRGFSFENAGPLDMRFSADADHPLTAAKIVNTWSEAELAEMFKELGEERNARRVAQAIVAERENAPFETTDQLVQVVETVIPRRGPRHPATKVFQALRISVNLELNNLKAFLPAALDALEPGGRLAVITFHSLEDRIVKRFFQTEAKACICPPELPVCQCTHRAQLTILTKKPVTASEEERKSNPRSRSAKLRVAEKKMSL
ncbi:MAG: 16S rRNA (cytosine(1402)-N(4))-methyltransferase RsmH [Candidatus Kerfeldbacteria bacterium]|nr:16S rRNA (cytosine(1402)-N(4))-methyltransferase RsmH [Candidatus Kerfeldbacteria bacterium]